MTVSALGHDDETPTKKVIDFEATSTHAGQFSYVCVYCGETLRTEAIPAHSHSYGYTKVEKEPTCTKSGTRGYYCGVCGVLYDTDTIDPTGHDDGVWKIDFEPTADRDGQMTRYCTACGKALESKSFAPHTHVKGYAKTIKDATCTVAGERGVFCAKCGAVYEIEEIPALGHDEGVWKLDFEGNSCYGYEGNLTKYCSRCGAALDTKSQSKYAEFVRDTSMISPAMGGENCVNDNAALYILIAMAAFAAAAGAGFAVRAKKRHN